MRKPRMKNLRMLATVLLFLVIGAVFGAATFSDYRIGRVQLSILTIIFLVYLLWIFKDIRMSQKAGERELKNIHYILDVEKNLFHAYSEASCFHRALQNIADFLPAERAFFWKVEENENIQQRWWNNGKKEKLKGNDRFQIKFPHLLEKLQKQKSVKFWAEAEKMSLPQEQMSLLREKHVLSIELRAKSLMIVPIKKRNGTLIGILGAVNMDPDCEDTEPLEQVAVSFAMTTEQYDTYHRLRQLSYIDVMTGLYNRNGFHEALLELEEKVPEHFACVYVDANGLHEINNRLGHEAGDEMLIQIAEGLNSGFPDDRVYRIGGDEFVVLCQNRTAQEVIEGIARSRAQIRRGNYEISVGVAWKEGDNGISETVKKAEKEMRDNKERFYNSQGSERYFRLLDEKAARVFSRQQDMETFFSVLAPQFKGVYFVDLAQDSIRHLFTTSYFRKILLETDGKFSKGLLSYARQMVKPAYYEAFSRLCDYKELWGRLEKGETPKLVYEKCDKSCCHLQVVKVNSAKKQEALWIFTECLQDDTREHLAKLAFVDGMTGGMNNAAFRQKYQQLVKENEDADVFIVLMNVRRFKLINEKLGFGEGNRILRIIYQELDKQMDESRNEFVARSEMDSFFLCLNESVQKKVKERVRRMEEVINQRLNGVYPGTYLTFTAGCCPVDDVSLDIRVIQDRARIAAGDEAVTAIEGCAFYNEELAKRIKREQELETMFDKALEEHEFQVYLQPKIDIKSGDLAGAEALVRWYHPTLGFIMPSDFIPVLERTGKICRLDFYVFEEVCRFYRRRKEKGRKWYPISVNLSRYHFYEEGFLDKFYKVYCEYGLPENSIEFELTESMFFDSSYNDRIKKGINRMHEMGFCCSMDDFGAGYSSLGILKEFDVDTIKMDRLFFMGMDNEKARDIIRSVVELAAKLQMKTVAEGIEQAEQMEFLHEIQCDAVQGFVFSRPLPLDEFESWVSQYEKE